MNDEAYIDENEEPLSVCCGASVTYSDICSSCKEHASFQVTCQGCKGRGSIYVNEHQEEPCPNCEDGYILIEE